ncbi:MAG: AAA family ATPase [Deltaproteobacteria bacterium]|nr:AAA family ATPase [Deltaproteobacteria bacterium]
MTFDEVLAQVQELLQREQRVSYRGLKRRFGLDDEYLEDLKEELIGAKRLAADSDGRFLVWTGGTTVPRQPLSVISPSPSAPSPQSLDARPQTLDSRRDAGERRQLTVMFCDVVGSTALSERLDPEDLREVMQAYQQACVAVITRFDGYVAKYLGDGVLVYFGYPRAHEDDAARAVRAGLGIIEAMQNLPLPHLRLPQLLQVRVGIHTGLVVAGEMGSGQYREERAIVGETPNIAARLQEHALPNSVVISATTFRLVTGLFECQELGPQVLKNVSVPMELYQVHGAGAAQNRFEAAVQKGLTPLVGRTEELELLQRRWEHAKAGAGQVVLLSGEPGIGKSRLVQELKEHVSAEGATRLEFHCSPYHHHSAFYPLIDHLQRLLQFAREDIPQVKLSKLQHVLASYRFPQADTLPLVAALLSVPQPEDTPPLTLSPQKQKQKTREALVAWILEEAEKTAVYCAWEDLHWADPSTLEFLSVLLDHAPTSRILALLTFRPEFTPRWGNPSHLSQLTLSRLGRAQIEAMVERVTGGKALPPEVVQQIVAKTDGVPLFVEELTKTVVESGLLTAVNDHYELSGPLPPLAVPSTLHASLLARLDRLSTVREIAQLGATIGREFSYELLQAVSLLDEERLQQGLKQLVETELVYQRGLPPQAHYLFKHALIRDTAYQALLKSTRQQYHRQIAQVLAERFPETVETQPELVAHHYTEAGQIEQALPYWQQAGERASQRSAYVEAMAHLTRGLEVLKTLPDTPERAQQEPTLQLALGEPLIATKGYTAPEVERAFTRARELCQQIGETPLLFPVLGGLWVFYDVRAELQLARELAEQFLSLAQRRQDPDLLFAAHLQLGETLFWLGELPLARAQFEQGVALSDPQQPRSKGWIDARVVYLAESALALWYLGYPDQALKRSHEALTRARELARPYTLAFALFWAVWVHQHRREGQVVQERIEAQIALASEQGFPNWMTWGTILRGGVLAEQGQGEEGIVEIRQGLAALRATGAAISRPYWLALLAEAYGKVGQPEEGLTVLAEALAGVDKNWERFCEAELYRLKGQLALQSESQSLESRTREAEACFHKAIEIARRQQAKSWELQAVMSLSRLWQQQGKTEEARKMLAEIYGWFTEGFDTKDLQKAKALLDKLS